MSFNSGILVTKQHSERDKADLRRHGLKGEEQQFVGATMSRRVHKTPRQNLAQDKEREEAEAFPMDREQVHAKRPKDRLKWLQRGLMFAAKKLVKIGDLYDIACHKKFVNGVNNDIGAQMEGMLLANLHLFSTKQQRYLQSSSSIFHEFSVRKPTEKSSEKHSEKASEKAAEKERAPSSDSESSSSTSSTKRAPTTVETQPSLAAPAKKTSASDSAPVTISKDQPATSTTTTGKRFSAAGMVQLTAPVQLSSDSAEGKPSGAGPKADQGQLSGSGVSVPIPAGTNGDQISNGDTLALIRLPGYYNIPFSCRHEEARYYRRGAADEFLALRRAGSRSRSREQTRSSYARTG